MSPQLQQILAHAKQLSHAEQLLLISHMVHHALPIAPTPEPAMLEARSQSIAPPPPTTPPKTATSPDLDDPQYDEFRDEITQYKQNLPSQ